MAPQSCERFWRWRSRVRSRSFETSEPIGSSRNLPNDISEHVVRWCESNLALDLNLTESGTSTAGIVRTHDHIVERSCFTCTLKLDTVARGGLEARRR